MTTPFRAWRFNHPDIVTNEKTDKPRRSSYWVETLEGDEVIQQSLLMLLSTRPGERVMKPDYGCPLHLLIFQPNDKTTAGLAKHYIKQAIERFERRVEIIKLEAYQDQNIPTSLFIELEYLIVASQNKDGLELSLDLQP